MAGHSKWKNIQHRKGAQDSKRGKIFSKLIKEITVAVKTGGADLDANPRLRLAIQNAKGANMPKDNIERAVKKASGSDSSDMAEITFEGYGPGGEGIFIECATDNKTRTVSSIRSLFNKFGGSLGKDGCLQFVFERKGFFTLNGAGLNEEEFSMEMIDSGADDLIFSDDIVEIVCAMEDFGKIQKKLKEKDMTPTEAWLGRHPIVTKQMNEEAVSGFMKLISAIEDDDDVQSVFHNVEIS